MLLMVLFGLCLFVNAENPIIKVGLKYGNTAVAEAFPLSFENGFQVGYISDDNSFMPIRIFGNNTVSVFGKASKVFLADTEKGTVLFEVTAGQPVALKPIEGASSMPYVVFNGIKYADVFKLSSDADGKISVVNIVDADLYMKGVLPSEVYPSWHEEALKAAAVATRTYTFYSMSGKHKAYGIDLCATTCCQVYSGISKCAQSTNKAVDDTKNQVLIYNGKLITAVYHAISGGVTESASGAWGSNQASYPYLTVVETPFEKYDEIKNGHWTNTLYTEDLQALIAASSYKNQLTGPVKSITVDDTTPGYLNNMTITDTAGNSIFLSTSSKIRSFFSKYVKSANFTITNKLVPSNDAGGDNISVLTANGKTTTKKDQNVYVLSAHGKEAFAGFKNAYIIEGKGYGHGVGLSQYGAQYAAKEGYKYDEILGIYYPGTTIVDYTTLGK